MFCFAYLGKANDLLKRMQGLTQAFRLKSYSHGVYKLKEMRKEEKSIFSGT